MANKFRKPIVSHAIRNEIARLIFSSSQQMALLFHECDFKEQERHPWSKKEHFRLAGGNFFSCGSKKLKVSKTLNCNDSDLSFLSDEDNNYQMDDNLSDCNDDDDDDDNDRFKLTKRFLFNREFSEYVSKLFMEM
ncbi:hypothetical protein AVEN_18895-1 [Araneus ventricosus]|uniref:Uncharacterized protein n=1 Tax=Araneus ventricosus TaxID=182803 RepID=A0A4Y2I9V2_ARAVE|nr:hypothetical protein AVEN_18895-1 [Araneus ventricosus]